MEYKDALDFPRRMNVSVDGSMEFTLNENHYVDHKTGELIPDWVPPEPDAMSAAMRRYLTVLEKYEAIILPGFFDFPEPKNIPEDLLMPFVELVEKYDLAAAVPTIWESTGQGLGDMMNVPAIWVMQASGVPMVRAMLGLGPSIVPGSGRLYDLYENVAKFLGGDVLYSSTVISAERRNGNKGVLLHVQGPDGKVTCVGAKRLLLAIEPDAENIAPFADKDESAILGKFKFPTVYAAVIQHPSLEPNHAYASRESGPLSLLYKAFPVAPQFGRIDYIAGTEDLFSVTAVGAEEDTPESIKGLLDRTIDDMIKSGVLPASASSSDITYKAFADHGHMHAHVTADELRAGFMQKLNSLQGRRNTFYTGAAFSAGFSTVLWEYNKVLLPKLVKGL